MCNLISFSSVFLKTHAPTVSKHCDPVTGDVEFTRGGEDVSTQCVHHMSMDFEL